MKRRIIMHMDGTDEIFNLSLIEGENDHEIALRVLLHYFMNNDPEGDEGLISPSAPADYLNWLQAYDATSVPSRRIIKILRGHENCELILQDSDFRPLSKLVPKAAKLIAQYVAERKE